MKGRFVALLRGINVGRAKRVAMADLRAAVEGLGYRDVRTLLNSGNVVFTAPAGSRGDPAARITAAVLERSGVSARATVLSAAELAEVLAAHPLRDVARDPSRLLIAVLADPADRRHVLAVARDVAPPEALAAGKRVAYVWCPDGVLESKALVALSAALGDRFTARNWATMQKLLAAAEQPAA